MHANQQRQYEEIQRQLAGQRTPVTDTTTPLSSEPMVPPTSAGSARPPKERLDTPAYFDASDLTLYPSRRSDMLAKLDVDGDAIGSLTNQGWYVDGRLKDRAKQKFHPWMEACEPSLHLEGGGQLWKDRMNISLLKKALSFELRKTLVSVEEATTYEAFCIQLRRLDDRLTKLKSTQAGGGKRYIHIANTPAAKDNPDAMDWVDSNTYAQARVSAAWPNYRVPGLTPEEAADRRRRGVCVNCERTGHIAVNCRSDHVPPHEKKEVRVNHATIEESSDHKEEHSSTEVSKQGKD
ncbi:hypothetical protein ACJ73_08232 [Blastomyces percursus]|uniref:CCHC-type domain-containing protein n=1 Tax=Blastomyces percursus TaxID=1658174 RepID=A0A1J9PVM5_9EURO|nr:hypothetical protein ACJ73_08232 [Blastomyces percursus]